MTQQPSVYAQSDLKSLNLVSWRIQKTRSESHRADVHRQLLERQHDAKAN